MIIIKFKRKLITCFAIISVATAAFCPCIPSNLIRSYHDKTDHASSLNLSLAPSVKDNISAIDDKVNASPPAIIKRNKKKTKREILDERWWIMYGKLVEF